MDVPTDQAGPALPATEIPAGERGGRGSSAQLVPSTARTVGETTDNTQTRPSSSHQPDRSCYNCGVAARMSGDVLYCGGPARQSSCRYSGHLFTPPQANTAAY